MTAERKARKEAGVNTFSDGWFYFWKVIDMDMAPAAGFLVAGAVMRLSGDMVIAAIKALAR